MDALLETDEETDAGAFAAYLRAQSDADLLDIQTHLDAERYPARVDSVRRETQRRHVLPVAVYTTEEKAMRGLALAALAFAAVGVLLALLLTSADAMGPRWVDLEQIPDGTPASELLLLTLLGLLRAVFVGGVTLAAAPLSALALGGWLLRRSTKRAVRADAKGLALGALLALLVTYALAAAPFSSIPLLVDPSAEGADFWARLARLLWPY